MNEQDISQILKAYKNGSLELEECKSSITELISQAVQKEERSRNYQDAVLDLDRDKRQGFPEVVYCEGKTDEQCITILKELNLHYSTYMGTRARQSIYDALKTVIPEIEYDETSRIIYRHSDKVIHNEGRTIAVVTAGTSDIPIAEEAAVTAELMGNEVTRIYDVGVAGIHRLFHRLDDITSANVVIVVAGMEGALASVIGGLVTKPIIAVPTSVGYGANFKGLAALLSMLNSCAAGVGVVNIDNGFGAGRLAHMINSQR